MLLFVTRKNFLVTVINNPEVKLYLLYPCKTISLIKLFYYIPTKDLENYCSQIPEKTSQRVSGTRKNHIFTKLLADQLHRQFSCLCDYVLNFTLIRVYFMESLSFSTCSHFTLLHMILVVMVFQKMLVISPNMNIMKPRCQL